MQKYLAIKIEEGKDVFAFEMFCGPVVFQSPKSFLHMAKVLDSNEQWPGSWCHAGLLS